jgi:hypothetical protein
MLEKKGKIDDPRVANVLFGAINQNVSMYSRLRKSLRKSKKETIENNTKFERNCRMIGTLILLVLIISIIVLRVKVCGQRRRIDRLENQVCK